MVSGWALQLPWVSWVAPSTLLEGSWSVQKAWTFHVFSLRFEVAGPVGLGFWGFGTFCLRLGRVQVTCKHSWTFLGALELRMDVSTVAQDSFFRSLGVRWPGPGGPYRALETLMDEPCVI